MNISHHIVHKLLLQISAYIGGKSRGVRSRERGFEAGGRLCHRDSTGECWMTSVVPRCNLIAHADQGLRAQVPK
jgi:hypothetical protein